MQLPPLQVTRAVIQRYARLLLRYGDELGTRPLVLPNSDFFPDRFERDEASLARLVARMQEHAGMSDIPIETAIIPRGADDATSNSCSSGTCAHPASARSGEPRLIDLEDHWRLQVPEAELSVPTALTANLARSLAYVFLVETQQPGEIVEPPVDVTADFAAVGLGFGALMLQGSYIYAKSCGGPSIASVTKVGIGELAVPVSLFIAMGQHSVRAAARELDATQRAVLEQGRELVEANRGLVRALVDHPARVADGSFELNEATSWLGRWLSKWRRTDEERELARELPEELALEEVEAMLIAMPPASRVGHSRGVAKADPARDEIRALVSEALENRS